jgi:hypothetical protein
MDISILKLLLQMCSHETLIKYIDDLTVVTVCFNFMDVFLYFIILFSMY